MFMALPPKSKRATTAGVMALVSCWFGWRRLHHPVGVGRLMPTLIRARRMARPRNMILDIMPQQVNACSEGDSLDGGGGRGTGRFAGCGRPRQVLQQAVSGPA